MQINKLKAYKVQRGRRRKESEDGELKFRGGTSPFFRARAELELSKVEPEL